MFRRFVRLRLQRRHEIRALARCPLENGVHRDAATTDRGRVLRFTTRYWRNWGRWMQASRPAPTATPASPAPSTTTEPTPAGGGEQRHRMATASASETAEPFDPL